MIVLIKSQRFERAKEVLLQIESESQTQFGLLSNPHFRKLIEALVVTGLRQYKEAKEILKNYLQEAQITRNYPLFDEQGKLLI